MNEKERQLICDKNDAYACLKSACEYAEAADGQFICHRKETRFYKGIYKVTVISKPLSSFDTSYIVEAQEDIPMTSVATVRKGEQFLTITRLLHKQKKEQ